MAEHDEAMVLVLKLILATVNGMLLCLLVALMTAHVQSHNKIKSWSTMFHLVSLLFVQDETCRAHGWTTGRAKDQLRVCALSGTWHVARGI